jgi:hypothetical protein
LTSCAAGFQLLNLRLYGSCEGRNVAANAKLKLSFCCILVSKAKSVLFLSGPVGPRARSGLVDHSNCVTLRLLWFYGRW